MSSSDKDSKRSSAHAANEQSAKAAAISDTTKKSGGVFNYLISRKKTNLSNTIVNDKPAPPSPSSPDHKSDGRMKYHRLANAAGSQYFGSMPLFIDDSDSDNEDNNTNSNRVAATLAAAASSTKEQSTSSSSFWLARFQSQENKSPQRHEHNTIIEDTSSNNNAGRSSPSSWMNKAWQTVDSATDWMSSSSFKLPSIASDNNNNGNDAAQQSSSWWTMPNYTTLSNAVSSINLPNPFKDDNDSTINGRNKSININQHKSSLEANNTNLILPKIASKFEWATKRRNPYQAVTGRVDIDYGLLSGPFSSVSLWGLKWLPAWFQMMDGNSLSDGITATNMKKERIVMKRKSLPSEASVTAVKNLLVLVQEQQHYDDHGDDDQQQQQTGPSSLQPRHHPSPLLSPVLSPQESFTPRSPSLQPFPDLPNDSSSFESDHSPNLSHHYPSPRMTPVQSFHASPSKQSSSDNVAPIPPALTLPKAASSPIIRHASNLQDAPLSTNPAAKSHTPNSNNNQAADAEMAARLAEGTLRAFRDLALDEATELHSALQHWTLRWERPFLGWLEAGPTVWFSERGYSPYSAGKKVSQIQAVLARRCAVIGEIQEHLWRASWQRGVAKWGMLGHGQGEWAAVMLEHGDMTNGEAAPGPSPKNQMGKKKLKKPISMKIFNHSSFVNTNVSNARGGEILVDEDALTRWSIDSIKVIRDQLYRAAPAGAQLPYYENWPNEVRHFSGVGHADEVDNPTWATKVENANGNGTSSIVISDLQGMADEVTALLQSIEFNLHEQRQRRLNKLRPQSNLRRNWYMFAVGIPTAAYATYHLCKEHGGYFLMKEVFAKINVFWKEHVSEPCYSIYQELFTKTGRIDVNDRKARMDTIESLKRMIRSWLDETFADMPEAEKVAMSNNMDISLIEELKEESIKHIYEINSVVRCSLIEMQFIKKELLNALVAMDELMGSNEINARLAAMTPAVILMIGIRKVFRLIFYALFKFGAPKQEIYASFRKIVLDIERLLLMRDDPPPRPKSLSWGSTQNTMVSSDIENGGQSRATLSAADLGMLLLHIHECRTILWESRRRFNNDVLRNVSEDLSEVAGERGPVSVKQQLQILSRMSRTYKFMKVDYRTMMG